MTNEQLLKKIEQLMEEKKAEKCCPTCGACPTCGHRPSFAPIHPYPVYPWYTYPFGTSIGGGVSGTITTTPYTPNDTVTVYGNHTGTMLGDTLLLTGN